MENFSDDDESVPDDIASSVQLGFIEHRHNELFHNSDWCTWDGGKVGGFPVSTS